MNTIFRNTIIGILVAMLMFAGLPLSSAHAAAPVDLPTPQAKGEKKGVPFIERAFARQQKILAHATKAYAKLDEGFPKLQAKIDKARAAGMDVTQVQAALDTVKKNLTAARPLYDQAKTIAVAHKGFDANGKVTDPTAARETVKSLHDIGKQFKEAMAGSIKTLRDAVKALRDAMK